MAAISQCASNIRFALLVKSLQWNKKIQCRSYCRQMLTLFELLWCSHPL